MILKKDKNIKKSKNVDNFLDFEETNVFKGKEMVMF